MVITNQVVGRVFMIEVNNSTAACTYMNINQRDIIVTCRHIFNVPNGVNRIIEEVSVHKKEGKITVNVEVLFHDNEFVDIAIIPLDSNKYHGIEIEDNHFLSEDVYIVGFPFNMRNEGDESYFPFVKKGIISGIVIENDVSINYIDCMNNPGFSGGLVVTARENEEHKIVGIVSGYKVELFPVLTSDSRPLIVNINSEPKETFIRANIGLARSTIATEIVEIIEIHK